MSFSEQCNPVPEQIVNDSYGNQDQFDHYLYLFSQFSESIDNWIYNEFF